MSDEIENLSEFLESVDSHVNSGGSTGRKRGKYGGRITNRETGIKLLLASTKRRKQTITLADHA